MGMLGFAKSCGLQHAAQHHNHNHPPSWMRYGNYGSYGRLGTDVGAGPRGTGSAHRRVTAHIVASAGGQPELFGMAPKQWERATDRLVTSSSIPFSILVLPQVMQNLVNMSSGNAASLSIISWEGYLSGLLGNTLMCTHFAGRGERSAVNVQFIGIINNLIVLSQVTIASFMPLPVFLSTVVLSVVAAVMNTGRLSGRVTEKAARGSLSTWEWWQLAAGVCGLAIIPQVMSNLLLPGRLGLLPGASTLLLLVAYFGYQMREPDSRQALGSAVKQLPGWGATLLFALSPLPQLVRNFLEPQSLEGLSVGTMLLALLGNSLMLPRALLTGDSVWIAGTSWALVAGWGQLLGMRLGTAAATGLSYLGTWPFAAVTLLLLAFVVFTVNMNASLGGVWYMSL